MKKFIYVLIVCVVIILIGGYMALAGYEKYTRTSDCGSIFTGKVTVTVSEDSRLIFEEKLNQAGYEFKSHDLSSSNQIYYSVSVEEMNEMNAAEIFRKWEGVRSASLSTGACAL